MADQKDPIRHHYVPRMLLKRFTDASENLWTFNKACPELGVLPKSIGSVFFEKHRYTVTKADGTKDASPERYMSPIEGDADRVIAKVVDAVRAGQVPEVSSEERQLWREFTRIQWLRRPDIVASNMSQDEFDDFLDTQIEALAPLMDRVPNLDLETLKSPIWRARMRKNLAAEIVTQPLHQVEETLSRMGLAIAVVKKPNKSFIIGSHPFIRCEPKGGGKLGSPGVEVWLPVARDVAISPIPGEGLVQVLAGISDVDLRRLNLETFRNSREIAGCSKTLVASIANQRGS